MFPINLDLMFERKDIDRDRTPEQMCLRPRDRISKHNDLDNETIQQPYLLMFAINFPMARASETGEWCEVCCSWIRDGRHRRDCPLFAEADSAESWCALEVRRLQHRRTQPRQ